VEHIGAFLGGPVVQIGIVVSDLDAALTRYAEIFGEDRWRLYTFGPFGRHEYYGAPTSFSSRLALNDASPQIELIQPLEGDSIHRDWLAARGEGLNHVAVVVPSVPQVIASMAALGCPLMQSGSGFGVGGDGDGAYAYIDATAVLGMIVEPIEQPSSLPPPDAIWPQGA
jgi:catechol 2,3-dioxygenase-like lactoylglutathione lyase family enzyme